MLTNLVSAVLVFMFARGSQRANYSIKLGAEKVVDKVALGDIVSSDRKNLFCRCWESKTFPYCDGSHAKHNKRTGDNTGPLIITGAPEKKA